MDWSVAVPNGRCNDWKVTRRASVVDLSGEYWATERYRLYAMRKDRCLSIDVQHTQWPLQSCVNRMSVDRAMLPAEMSVDMASPHVLFSTGVEALTFAPVYYGR